MTLLGQILKKETNEYIIVSLMVLFIITDMKLPVFLANLIDTLFGRIIVIIAALALFFMHNVLGTIGLIFAYELIKRSEKETGSYQMRHYLPSENVKGKHFDAMNQFPVTLEEQVIAKLVPISKKHLPAPEFKPIQNKLHDAAKI